MISVPLTYVQQAAVLVACLLGSFLIFGIAQSSDTQDTDQLYSRLEAADRALAEKAVQTALETRLSRSSFRWLGDDGALHGKVTPLRTYKEPSGVYCREYREIIHASKALLAATRTACRNGDGVWTPIAR